jgi:nitric oxide dioxygenase
VRYLVDTGDARPVWGVHADRSLSVHAHRTELEELVAELPAAIMHNWYEDLGVRPESQTSRAGRTDLSSIALPVGVKAYLCGPLPFMQAMRAQLLEAGVPAVDIAYEVFRPDLWLQVA